PLFLASIRQDHEAVAALITHGAEVDLPNVAQMTPLMVALGMTVTGRAPNDVAPAPDGDVQGRAIKIVDLLLAGGANINAQVLGSRNRTGILQTYIPGRDREGRTALFAAAEAGRDREVKHLLDRGADPSVRDATGKTALDWARAPAPSAGGVGATVGLATPAERAATVTLLAAATVSRAAN
ncbi:MAG: ankyrin repeat domain-containing protein, partial [Pseudomonadota bacterium]